MRSMPETTRAAFTLIEVLIVVLILTILATLVVSMGATLRIASGRQKTMQYQSLVMAGVRAYYGVRGFYPAEGISSGTAIPIPVMSAPRYYGGDHYDHPYYRECMASKIRNANLYLQLLAEPESAKTVQALPPLALFRVPNQLWSLPGVNYVFRDGYNNDMDYRVSAGLGGRPVLISAGPDGAFGFGTFQSSDADNIRSDAQSK
jgi:prepilin-type N-terminal cleavage/methylation domain-containing protein